MVWVVTELPEHYAPTNSTHANKFLGDLRQLIEKVFIRTLEKGEGVRKERYIKWLKLQGLVTRTNRWWDKNRPSSEYVQELLGNRSPVPKVVSDTGCRIGVNLRDIRLRLSSLQREPSPS